MSSVALDDRTEYGRLHNVLGLVAVRRKQCNGRDRRDGSDVICGFLGERISILAPCRNPHSFIAEKIFRATPQQGASCGAKQFLTARSALERIARAGMARVVAENPQTRFPSSTRAPRREEQPKHRLHPFTRRTEDRLASERSKTIS